MRLQSFGGITYRYRHDPVPYCGVYRYRKPSPPYNRRIRVLNTIQEEEYRPLKDPVFKEVVWQHGNGCIHCYRIHHGRHQDRSWKTSYKCSKQWMKHQKKHYPTIKYSPGEEFDNHN